MNFTVTYWKMLKDTGSWRVQKVRTAVHILQWPKWNEMKYLVGPELFRLAAAAASSAAMVFRDDAPGAVWTATCKPDTISPSSFFFLSFSFFLSFFLSLSLFLSISVFFPLLIHLLTFFLSGFFFFWFVCCVLLFMELFSWFFLSLLRSITMMFRVLANVFVAWHFSAWFHVCRNSCRIAAQSRRKCEIPLLISIRIVASSW